MRHERYIDRMDDDLGKGWEAEVVEVVTEAEVEAGTKTKKRRAHNPGANLISRLGLGGTGLANPETTWDWEHDWSLQILASNQNRLSILLDSRYYSRPDWKGASSINLL